MRIAIVGAGVSGLVVAHRLHERHEVTVFEERPRVGGHTNTVRVDLADETHRSTPASSSTTTATTPASWRLHGRASGSRPSRRS